MADNGMLLTRPSRRPRPWLMSMGMYNAMAPWFGHKAIPPAPLFPITDYFLKQQANKPMTEQSIIEYAKTGDKKCQIILAEHYGEVCWEHAITHVNGRPLNMPDIKKTYDQAVEINKETGMPMTEVTEKLQAALNAHHAPSVKPLPDFEYHEPSRRMRGTNRTPPKKKRK
jgi:hypothetical protein